MSIKLKRSDEEMRWKVLSSQYVVKEPWMTVRKDKLMLPDGRIKDDYWSLEYPDWINVIAITQDGKYLFERQYRHGLDVVGGCPTGADGRDRFWPWRMGTIHEPLSQPRY